MLRISRSLFTTWRFAGDILHLTKLHETIINAWEVWFKVLKQDIVVCLSPLILTIYLLELFIESCGKSQFHWRFLVGQQSLVTYLYYWALVSKKPCDRWSSVDEHTTCISPLTFHHLCGSHDGKSMAAAVLELQDQAGITANVHLSSHVLITITWKQYFWWGTALLIMPQITKLSWRNLESFFAYVTLIVTLCTDAQCVSLTSLTFAVNMW